jgi:hypothetical protein
MTIGKTAIKSSNSLSKPSPMLLKSMASPSRILKASSPPEYEHFLIQASKTELTTGLSLKANIADVSKTIDEISLQIEDKLSYSDLNELLKEYLHRSELTKALSERHYER